MHPDVLVYLGRLVRPSPKLGLNNSDRHVSLRKAHKNYYS